MKFVKNIVFILLGLLLFSCAPVLNRDVMREGDRDVSFNRLRQDPAGNKGRVYIFGGVIVRTTLTAGGSQIEAMEVPVDRYGYFRERGMSEGRFLAFVPAEERMLDPEVFEKGRRITFAGEFTELRKGRIDEMEYTYPVFRIRQLYLWPRDRRYYPENYYDPWFSPYPYFFGGPWWSYPYYYDYYYRNNYYYGGTLPGHRRSPLVNPTPPQLPAPRPHQQMEQAPGGSQQPSGAERVPEQRGRP